MFVKSAVSLFKIKTQDILTFFFFLAVKMSPIQLLIWRFPFNPKFRKCQLVPTGICGTSFLEIFQWDEPTKRVRFNAEPEIPEILTKWEAPFVKIVVPSTALLYPAYKTE